jgi:hypothetical protein
MARRTSEEVEMTRKLSIAIAAGLLLAGPAFADDQDQDKTQDQTRDQAKDGTGTHTSAGIGAQVKVLAKDQKPGDGTNGIGEQVRTMAQLHGCDVNGSAECKARLAAHEALAEKAGSPTDKPALPSAAADRGQTERSQTQTQTQTRTRAQEAEQAAQRHSERMAAGQDVDDMHSNGHRAGHGDGHGMGDSMQGAETRRSGDAHPMGTGGGMTPGGGMP